MIANSNSSRREALTRVLAPRLHLSGAKNVSVSRGAAGHRATHRSIGALGEIVSRRVGAADERTRSRDEAFAGQESREGIDDVGDRDSAVVVGVDLLLRLGKNEEIAVVVSDRDDLIARSGLVSDVQTGPLRAGAG